MKNKIFVQNFGSFRTEALKIDYIRFNLGYLRRSQIIKLAVYFRRLGFNSFIKKRDNSQKRTSIFDDKQFEITFILNTPYSEGTHIEFAGQSANQLYFLTKENKFSWNRFKQYRAFLRRIDTCYDRIQKSTDKISNDTFMEDTLVQFKRFLPNNNIEYKKNRSGQTTAVGHRTSDKYYRVYIKDEYLRFEFEHKHRPTLNLYYSLLETKQFEQLERSMSFEFFKQTYQLFRYSQQPEKVDWIALRLRPFQNTSSLGYSNTTINMHYIHQCPIKKPQKEDLIKLFQLLEYVKSLNNYKTANLTSKFRQYIFPVREFVESTNMSTKVNTYQVRKASDFFNHLKYNIVFEFLSDKSYRMLVTIPEASSNKVQNQWIAEVWVADEFFNYFEPLAFTNYFKKKRMSTYEFFVLFEIIHKFNVPSLRKELDISRFLDSLPSKLNGKRKKEIKEWFIYYIKDLHLKGKIQDQIVFPLLSFSNPKREIKISDLSLKRLMEPFIIFEVLEVSFVKNILLK